MRRISNSEIQTWKECRRRWFLQYRRRLVLRRESPTGPAAIGTRVHTVIASYYDGRINQEMRTHSASTTPLALHDALVAADLEAFPEFADQIDKDASLTRAMVEGYLEWIEDTGADEGLEIVAPEQRLAYEILPGVELQGKIDVRVRREHDGARMVLDHKTVDNFSQPTALLPIDEQMKTYLLLERLCDPDARTDGAIYNMLRKVKRTARANPPFFERAEIRHNVHVMRDFYDRLIVELTDILNAETEDPSAFYPSPTKNCSWKCPFFGVCPMMDDPTLDAEQYIEMFFEEGDPYARYETGEATA